MIGVADLPPEILDAVEDSSGARPEDLQRRILAALEQAGGSIRDRIRQGRLQNCVVVLEEGNVLSGSHMPTWDHFFTRWRAVFTRSSPAEVRRETNERVSMARNEGN